MNGFARNLRQTFTIARRDFVATVFTPTFLIFLLAPLFMTVFGIVGGMGAASVKQASTRDEVIIAIVAEPDREAVTETDRQLRRVFPLESSAIPPVLDLRVPDPDPAAQARTLFHAPDGNVTAVLYGPLSAPTILVSEDRAADSRYLAQLAEQSLRVERIGTGTQLSRPDIVTISHDAPTQGGRGSLAVLGTLTLFILTLTLSTQAIGTMAEERSNKVIEILAAAVPLESVFFGKLLGTLAVALLFLLFWGVVAVNIARLAPPELAQLFLGSGAAVGVPAYPILFLLYFVMAFLLLSAVFLGIGAQASTQRELQLLSMPLTIFQIAMLGLATTAAGAPGSAIAWVAEIFPFSSPFAMVARAANVPGIWPHLLALGWQIVWLVITITIGARMFRRGVLKSGSPRRARRHGATQDAETQNGEQVTA